MHSVSRENSTSIDPSPIGRRVHVAGNSASGKSTLAERLARALDAEFVELDALNWLPDWVGLNETDPSWNGDWNGREATRGEAWVVAGSYHTYSQRTFWARLDTVVWLDLPMLLLLKRVMLRSWRRWRRRELLWGSNVERFWTHFLLWRKNDSLIYWILTQHARKRRAMLALMADSCWSHIRFVRLVSVREVETFAGAVEAALRP